MRDKADVAQFKFLINVAKSIFLIEIPKKFTASPCIFSKKTFLSLKGVSADKEFSWADSGRVAQGKARSHLGADPATWRFLPGVVLASWHLADSYLRPLFQFESLITCCTMIQEKDCLFEVTFSDVILYE